MGFSTTYYCENLFLVSKLSEHTGETAIYWNESASLINEKCNFEYYHELNLNPECWMQMIISYEQDCQFLGHFSTKERQISNPTEGSPYIITKRTQLCFCSISAEPYYLLENVLSCEDENVELHMYYTVNMAVLNYFGTQIPEIETINALYKLNQQNCMEKTLLNQKTISQFQMYYYLKIQ